MIQHKKKVYIIGGISTGCQLNQWAPFNHLLDKYTFVPDHVQTTSPSQPQQQFQSQPIYQNIQDKNRTSQYIQSDHKVLNSVEVIDAQKLIQYCTKINEQQAIQSTNCKSTKTNFEYLVVKDHSKLEKKTRLEQFVNNEGDRNRLEFLEICALKIARYGLGTFIYKQKIYVFGGLNQQNKLVSQIDRFHVDNHQWEILDFKFPIKIYSMGLALNGSDLLIIGGRNKDGLSPSIYQLDMINRRYKSRGNFSFRFRPKVLLKQYFNKDKFRQMIYVFGGDSDKSCEKLNPQSFVAYGSDESYTSIVDTDLCSFADSQTSLNLDWAQEICEPYMMIIKNKKYKNGQKLIHKPSFNEKQLEDYLDEVEQEENNNFYLFGSHQMPFVLEVNFGKNSVNIFDIGMDYRLYQYGQNIRIDQYLLISVGGSRPNSKKVSRKCQILSLVDFHSKQLAKMKYKRFKFGSFYDRPNKMIYVFGGISFDQNQQQVILNVCERYDISKNRWDLIAEMPIRIFDFGVCGFSDYSEIYLIGGKVIDKYNKIEVTNLIYLYNIKEDRWSLFEFCLTQGISNFYVTVLNRFQKQVLIVGGENNIQYCNSLIVLDLNSKKIKVNKQTLVEQRKDVLGFVYDQKLIVLGGNSSDIGLEVIEPSDKMINNYVDFFTLTNTNFQYSYKKYSFRVIQNYPQIDFLLSKYYRNKIFQGVMYC